jgi:hypothetical protein
VVGRRREGRVRWFGWNRGDDGGDGDDDLGRLGQDAIFDLPRNFNTFDNRGFVERDIVANPTGYSTCRLLEVGLGPDRVELTGGKGLFTQWAHVEFIVSSETICPANTPQVHGVYFLIVPTKVPPGYFVNGTLDFFHNSLTQVPTRYFVKETLKFFHNSPTKVLIRHFLKETLDLFHNSLPKVPIGTL